MKAIRYISGSLEIMGFFTVVLLSVVFAISHDRLDEATNAIQGYNIVSTMCYMLGIIIYGVLFILKRFPRFMVYPVKLDPANISVQIALSKLMLVILKVCFNVLFISVLLSLYSGQQSSAADILIALMAIAIPGDIIIYMVIARRRAN